MTLPAPRRDARGRLLPGPGQSLNPGGRPKGIEAVRELLAPHVQDFVSALVELRKSDSESIRLAAIIEFMNRYAGKPIAMVDQELKTFDMRELYLLAVQAASRAPAAALDITPLPADEPAAEIATNRVDDTW